MSSRIRSRSLCSRLSRQGFPCSWCGLGAVLLFVMAYPPVAETSSEEIPVLFSTTSQEHTPFTFLQESGQNQHRSPKFEKPRLFDPRDSRPTIVKLGFPLMLWLGVFGLYHPPEKPGGLILLGLLALLSLFFFTLALIVPTDRYLEYKRFIQWRTISYKEVSKCGRSVFPLVGYIKLKRFLPPWGRLYFVFYTPSAPFFGRAEQEAILEHIQDKIAGRAEAGTAEA